MMNGSWSASNANTAALYDVRLLKVDVLAEAGKLLIYLLHFLFRLPDLRIDQNRLRDQGSSGAVEDAARAQLLPEPLLTDHATGFEVGPTSAAAGTCDELPEEEELTINQCRPALGDSDFGPFHEVRGDLAVIP